MFGGKSYQQLLTLGKEAVESLRAKARSNEMEKKAELEIAKLESKILEQEAEIERLSSIYPINFDQLISAQDYRDLTKRRLAQFRNLVNQLFPKGDQND